MNESALIEELRKPEYAGLTDQQAADAVNAKTVQQSAPVAAQQIRLTLASRGKLAAIKRIGDNTAAPEPPYDACATLMALLDAGDTIDLQNAAVSAASAILIQHNLLTQADADAVAALAVKTVPWVDVEGIGEVGIGFVINARRAIAGGA
ncbi:MAG: hypothetical protein ACK528_01160 [Alphaproteobacteria bacterium]|jgi:hypothetical protein